MSAFGQKVAAPVRTYEEEMKFLSRNDATSWTIKPGFVPNMRVRRGVPSCMHHRRASSPGERVVGRFLREMRLRRSRAASTSIRPWKTSCLMNSNNSVPPLDMEGSSQQ